MLAAGGIAAGDERTPGWLRVVLGVGVLGAILFLIALGIEAPLWVRIAIKPFPVLALMVWLWARRRDAYAKAIMAGLAWCLVGDALLEERQRLFVAGLGAFLVGHLAFLVAFLIAERGLYLVRALPFLAWGVGLDALMFTQGNGAALRMQVPLVLYTLVLCSMMWRACAQVDGERLAWPTVAGALLFGGSDSLIAVNRFLVEIPHARFPVMLTYWAALALLAWAPKSRA